MPPKDQSQNREKKQREVALTQAELGMYFSKRNKKGDESEGSLVSEGQQSLNESQEVTESVNMDVTNEEVDLSEPHGSGEMAETVDANGVPENVEDDAEGEELERIRFSSLKLEDPGNWNNVCQRMREYIVEMGPKRVDGGFVFPKDSNNQHFDPSYYVRVLVNREKVDRRWLVYSVSLDRLFCFGCKLFKTDQVMSEVGSLSSDGYKDWQNLHKSLKDHETSQDHMKCMVAWIELERRLEKQKAVVDESLQLQINKERRAPGLLPQISDRRQQLTKIISIVKLFAKTNWPFRGDNEKLYDEDNGLFLQMIEFVTKFDPLMEHHVRCCEAGESQYNYFSLKFQNELIGAMADEVRKAILAKVKHAKQFSVILDCNLDADDEKQMAIILRFVDDLADTPRVEEYWVEFLNVDDATGPDLSTELLNVLTRLGLDIDDLRGQGYGSGYNMSERYNSVQKRLLEINPRALCTSYGCHSLNLAVVETVQRCQQAMLFFSAVQRIYTLFSFSPERWKVFQDKVPGLTPKSMSQTHWECDVESVKALIEQSVHIRDALLDLSEDTKDPYTHHTAESLVVYDLETFEFLLGMAIWYKLLCAVNPVSEFLQSEDMDIGIAVNLLQGLVAYLDEYREHGFASAMDEAKEMAREIGIEPKFQEKRIIGKKKQFDETGSNDAAQSSEESFRVEYFLFIIDQARSSLQVWLEQLRKYEQTFGFLLNLEKLKSEPSASLMESCMKLEQFLSHNGRSDIDGGDLFSELVAVRCYLTSEKRAIDMIQLLRKLNSSFSKSNIYIAYKILLTIPVTDASEEKSFSKLESIKNYLQSRMSLDGLNGLAMLSIENELVEQLDFTDVIDAFASKTFM